MKLVFIGADHEVTGSCHYIEAAGKKILVDCGMEQGRNYYENMPIPVKAHEIDAVFLTHAHIDHSGLIPKLVKEGFTGQIISTDATMRLCDIMLRDSAHIQEQEAQEKTKRAARSGGGEVLPEYEMQDAMATMKLFTPYPYGKEFTYSDGIRFRLTDIGHLLGSASIELWLTEGDVTKKLVFSGDIGNINQPILRDPQTTDEADYVIMESTYGNRLHERPKGDFVADLTAILKDTFTRGGNLIIPAFAVGRTQIMLYFIRIIKEQGLLPEFPDFPVYVDSPLAVSATEVFAESDRECFDEETQAVLRRGRNPIICPNLHLLISTDESKAINDDMTPKVIISASGMCDAGRIRHHLKYNLWRPDSTVLFAGYQSEGSLGRKLQDGAETVKLFGEEIKVRAKITRIDGMSGHADQKGLLAWAGAFQKKPDLVFVVHGEDTVCDEFADALHEELGLKAVAPYSGSEFDLIAGEFTKTTEGIPVERAAAKRSVSDSYTNLKIAEKRLSRIIEAAQGMANKDLDRFAAEVAKLAEKYKIDDDRK